MDDSAWSLNTERRRCGLESTNFGDGGRGKTRICPPGRRPELPTNPPFPCSSTSVCDGAWPEQTGGLHAGKEPPRQDGGGGARARHRGGLRLGAVAAAEGLQASPRPRRRRGNARTPISTRLLHLSLAPAWLRERKLVLREPWLVARSTERPNEFSIDELPNSSCLQSSQRGGGMGDGSAHFFGMGQTRQLGHAAK